MAVATRPIYTPTEDHLVRFTEGGCMILAQLLHELTGWQFCSFWCPDFEEPNDHAFVRVPDGRYMDVHGIQTEDELWTNFYGRSADHHRTRSRIHDVDPAAIPRLVRDWSADCDYADAETRDEAHLLADRLMQLYTG